MYVSHVGLFGSLKMLELVLGVQVAAFTGQFKATNESQENISAFCWPLLLSEAGEPGVYGSAAHVLSMVVGTGAGPVPWKLAAFAQVTVAVAVSGPGFEEDLQAKSAKNRTPNRSQKRRQKGLNLSIRKGSLKNDD
jgi:hypothetical protein